MLGSLSETPFKPRSTAVVTRFLYRMFGDAGLDVEQIFERSGIDPQQLDEPMARIVHENLLKMWEVAGELSDDPYFGLHLATQVPTIPFNTVGYLAMSSQNLREVLNSLIRYIKVYTDNGKLQLREEGGVARVMIDLSCGEVPNRQHTDFWLVFLMRNLNNVVGWEVPLIEAGFSHQKPEDTSDYKSFFRANIKFDTSENYLSFDCKYLDVPSINANSAVHKMHETQAIQQLHALTEGGILYKVKQAIFESLPAKNIDLNEVAAGLNITPRTVQRNLASEHTTFKKLVDTARKEYTLTELSDTKFTIAEVAYRLGYRDLSSFYRAFKRWTGMTPVNYRESQRKIID